MGTISRGRKRHFRLDTYMHQLTFPDVSKQPDTPAVKSSVTVGCTPRPRAHMSPSSRKLLLLSTLS